MMNEPIRSELVRRYADAIMVAIQADMDAGIVPRSVSTFTELHDYVDANEYAVLADVPWGSDPEALKYDNNGYALVNAVEGAVSAMLAVSVWQTTPSATRQSRTLGAHRNAYMAVEHRIGPALQEAEMSGSAI